MKKERKFGLKEFPRPLTSRYGGILMAEKKKKQRAEFAEDKKWEK